MSYLERFVRESKQRIVHLLNPQRSTPARRSPFMDHRPADYVGSEESTRLIDQLQNITNTDPFDHQAFSNFVVTMRTLMGIQPQYRDISYPFPYVVYGTEIDSYIEFIGSGRQTCLYIVRDDTDLYKRREQTSTYSNIEHIFAAERRMHIRPGRSKGYELRMALPLEINDINYLSKLLRLDKQLAFRVLTDTKDRGNGGEWPAHASLTETIVRQFCVEITNRAPSLDRSLRDPILYP